MNFLKTLHPSKLFALQWKRTLIILFVAQAFTAIGFSSIFPFLPLFVETLGTSTQLSLEFLVGMVYSAQAFTMMLASPLWGALADRVGRKPMVERAMFGGAVLIVLMSFVQTAEQLVLLRAIQGGVTGVVAASNALVASVAPRNRTGFAMGLLQVATGAGIALGPILGGVIADTLGYNTAFYITGSLLFAAGILVHFGIQEDFVPSEIANGKFAAIFIAEWRSIFSTAGVKITFAVSFLYMLGRMMIVPIAPLFIETLLHNDALVNTATGLVTGTAAAAITLSAVFLGRLGDRTGHRRIVTISAGLAALLYFAQSFVTAIWQLLILQALVGICLGGILPGISALLARYTKDGEVGAVYGLNNSIRSAGRSLAPLIAASIAARFDLRATFVATAVFFLITTLVSRFLPRPPTPRLARTSSVGG
jgi:DHA1 family multidrug resistance protein-like MFS transporter